MSKKNDVMVYERRIGGLMKIANVANKVFSHVPLSTVCTTMVNVGKPTSEDVDDSQCVCIVETDADKIKEAASKRFAKNVYSRTFTTTTDFCTGIVDGCVETTDNDDGFDQTVEYVKIVGGIEAGRFVSHVAFDYAYGCKIAPKIISKYDTDGVYEEIINGSQEYENLKKFAKKTNKMNTVDVLGKCAIDIGFNLVKEVLVDKLRDPEKNDTTSKFISMGTAIGAPVIVAAANIRTANKVGDYDPDAGLDLKYRTPKTIVHHATNEDSRESYRKYTKKALGINTTVAKTSKVVANDVTKKPQPTKVVQKTVTKKTVNKNTKK